MPSPRPRFNPCLSPAGGRLTPNSQLPHGTRSTGWGTVSGRTGWFGESDPILWWSPDPRAIFEMDGLYISRRLERTRRSGKFHITIDQAFGYGKTVICGHTPYKSPLRGPDWINIDTGCGKLPSAPLTALLLPEMEIVQG